jgi:hypothetical protein
VELFASKAHPIFVFIIFIQDRMQVIQTPKLNLAQRLLACSLFFLAAVFNYICFRQDIAIIYEINDYLFSIKPVQASAFFKYQLSDLLWHLTLIQIVFVLYKAGTPKVYLWLLVASPFISEFMQLFKLAPGTFDYFDLLIYLTITTLFLKPLKPILYEKN